VTPQERVAAVEKEGFTRRQAGFLVTVMLHSGVCLGRQYCAYSRIVVGRRCTTSSPPWLPQVGHAVLVGAPPREDFLVPASQSPPAQESLDVSAPKRRVSSNAYIANEPGDGVA
jgi:hypothetical protein